MFFVIQNLHYFEKTLVIVTVDRIQSLIKMKYKFQKVYIYIIYVSLIAHLNNFCLS